MKQILVIFTGGTIGSSVAHGTIDTDEQARFKLLEQFWRQCGDESVSFCCLQPVQILSENLHPDIWRQLIVTLSAQDLSGFDGVIITHGTDTLAFTAAALALYFHALAIPLVFVSSNYPLDSPQANGLRNFICAVELIRQRPISGAFVVYQNSGQVMQVHLATHLLSCLPMSSDFISVQNRPYLSFVEGRFFEHFSLPGRQEYIFPPLQHFSARRVILIKPYPGLDYSQFALQEGDIVLHDLYHSGTACSSKQWGDKHCLVTFVHNCQALNVPVYLAPMLYSEQIYGSTRRLIDAGAQVLWNISLEVAYVKLLLAYALFNDEKNIREFLALNLAWESIV